MIKRIRKLLVLGTAISTVTISCLAGDLESGLHSQLKDSQKESKKNSAVARKKKDKSIKEFGLPLEKIQTTSRELFKTEPENCMKSDIRFQGKILHKTKNYSDFIRVLWGDTEIDVHAISWQFPPIRKPMNLDTFGTLSFTVLKGEPLTKYIGMRNKITGEKLITTDYPDGLGVYTLNAKGAKMTPFDAKKIQIIK